MYTFLKRFFDLTASILALVVLLLPLSIIAVWIVTDSPGGLFYRQLRVGKGGREFWLLKFRSMRPGSDHKGQLTVGNDARVTRVGRFIRRYKIDELPQLFNIIRGEMSVVGPRPEVPKYVALYNEEQRQVLQVLPGLTDYASLEFLDEQKILGRAADPEKAYIEEVLPQKLRLSLKYIRERSFMVDLRLIFRTLFGILK